MKTKAEAKNKVILSHPEKIYWPKEKYTKQDLMDYYMAIAPTILPFLKDRPLVMRRFPDGIEGESFIQKDTSSLHLPDWIDTITIDHNGKNVSYFMIQNEKTLEYVVNLGTIELHTFHTKKNKLEHPDYFVLDLDPIEVPFEIVAKTALQIHEIFEKWKIPNFCKTSGARGIHIYIPLHAKYTIDQVAQFGTVLSTLLNEEIPSVTSLERSPSKRQKKIYLDVLQNRSMQTLVAPYSVRGRPYATVSTPLHWEELKKGITPQDFTIKTILPRIKKIGEIFSPILGKGFDMKEWIYLQQQLNLPSAKAPNKSPKSRKAIS